MRNGYRLKELKIELNRDCPLRCLHCSSNGMPHAPEYLQTQRVLSLLSEFIDMGGERLCISGGEPLCYKYLRDIIDTCQRVKVETALYTTGIFRNGSSPKAISKEMASFLTETDTRVIFSIHGACASTHDLLTQVEGSFFCTIKAIEDVLAAGASVEIHVVPMALNIDEIPDIAKLALSLNVYKISWLRFVPQGRGYYNKDILQLSKKQLQQLVAMKMNLQQLYPKLTVRTGSPFNILCPQVPTPCEAGLSLLTIRPDGCIAPCDAFKQFENRDKFRNVLNHSLSEVWEKSSQLNTVRALHETQMNSSCVSCHLYPQCNSGCLAQKTIFTNRFTADRDPDCPLDGTEVKDDEIKAIPIC